MKKLTILWLAVLLAAASAAIADNVTVTNPYLASQQYGSWSFSVLNWPAQYSVTQGGLFNVGEYGQWYVGQYGPWSVGIASGSSVSVNPGATSYVPVAENSWVWVVSVSITADTGSTTVINLTQAAGVSVPLRVMMRAAWAASGGQGFVYEIGGSVCPWTVASLAANYVPLGAFSQIPLNAGIGSVAYIRGSGTASTFGSMALYRCLTYTTQ